MTDSPLIMALDLATVSGFCIGRAGEKPRYGTWRLKTPEDDAHRASRNLGCRLRDEFRIELPDLLVIEAAMDPGAMHHAGNAARTVSFLWMLQGAVDAISGCYGIRVKRANVRTVRKSVLGNGRPENPKEAVVACVNRLGFAVKDHNIADALVLYLDECGYRHGLDLNGVIAA